MFKKLGLAKKCWHYSILKNRKTLIYYVVLDDKNLVILEDENLVILEDKNIVILGNKNLLVLEDKNLVILLLEDEISKGKSLWCTLL